MGRQANRYSYRGQQLTLVELAALAGVNRNAMYARIHSYGFTVDRAVETVGNLRGGHKPNWITFEGTTHTLHEWARLANLDPNTLNWRLSNGWTVEQALTVPTVEQRRRGVVSNFDVSSGTGAGSTAQETPEITFSDEDDF